MSKGLQKEDLAGGMPVGVPERGQDYIVARRHSIYAQGSQVNLHYEKFLDQLRIEPVTLSKVLLNTRAFTASAIWALFRDELLK